MPKRDHQPSAHASSEDSASGTAGERMAYTVEEAAAMLGIGRDLIYDEIRMRHLRSKKVGARRIIGRHHILEWLDADECDRRLLAWRFKRPARSLLCNGSAGYAARPTE
jgi:excisionase family DNA binding protein